MDKTVVVDGNEIVIKGEVMFSNLREAKGFKDNEDKKNFAITVRISAEHAEEVAKAIDDLEASVFEQATKDLTPVQKKTAAKALPKYRDIADAAGNPTGEIRVEFKRPEKLGSPAVRTPQGTVLENKPFINKGSTVAIRAKVRGYKMANTHGTSYTLQDILLIEEAARQSGASKSNPNMDKIMAVNIDDLPF